MPTRQSYLVRAPIDTRELRQLVGIPWQLYGSDPDQGLDCLYLCAVAWRIIGRTTGEEARWAFPIPEGYASGQPSARALVDYWRLWTPTPPIFGAVVDIGGSHLGILLERGEILHASEPLEGVAITRASRLRHALGGCYRLRRRGEPIGPYSGILEQIRGLRRTERRAVS